MADDIRSRRTVPPPIEPVAAAHPHQTTVRALAELMDAQLLTPSQFDTALAALDEQGRPLSKLLVDLGFVTEEGLPLLFARWKGLETVDLVSIDIDPDACRLVPFALARRGSIIPIAFRGDRLAVAVSDPLNVMQLDDIRLITGREIDVLVSTRQEILDALNRINSKHHDTSTLERLETVEEDDGTDYDAGVEDAPVVRAVTNLIARAVQMRASDIHIEPDEHHVKVRYRIDGVLNEVMHIPREYRAGIAARLKLMSGTNIAERRLPQDGRITVNIEGNPVDLRVATLPTAGGEEVIIRILDHGKSLTTLEDIGLSPYILEPLTKASSRPHGAVLVTGPTGSGKSTTLYAALNLLNDPRQKIITVEDPVEFRMLGPRQVQVNPGVGLTFARTLRAIMRSDPDVIMVGEIRDRETAGIAVQAAMTGHMVLSTLHTMDATSAPTRLVDMGVEPFLVSSALTCVLAQRLCRRLCPRCRDTYKPDVQQLVDLGFDADAVRSVKALWRPVGCNYCNQSGYHGRIAVGEVMVVTDAINRMIAEHRPAEELRRVAIEEGLLPIRQDGWKHAVAGTTSIEEVIRVTQ